MAEVRNRTFSDQAMVDIDGTTFIGCNFESASLRYSGGAHPVFEDCAFAETGWYFSDAALRTIQLLQQLHSQPGSTFIADLFRPGNYIVE
jgi:hypothetical protein